MPKFHLSSLLLASVVGLTACGGSDSPKSSPSAPINRTHVVFSPATSELPITNDLLFSSETAADGTMNAGTDPGNPVISGIDALDGRSVLAPFDIMFDGSLDANQSIDAASFIQVESNFIPNPNQNVFLLPLAYPSGDGLSQASIQGASVEIPTFAEAVTYQTAVATADAAALMELATPTARAEIISLDGGTNNVLRITPIEPLMPKTKYLVVVTSLIDRYGNDVERSGAYNLIRDPATDFSKYGDSGAALAALRPAIQGWESLAAGYFGFVEAVFSAAGQSVPVPSVDDIIFSMTFTTGGTTDVLTYVTAPEQFFADSLTSGFKKDAIVKTVSGAYQLDGTTDLTAQADVQTAATLNFLLTSQTLPDSSPNALYNASIAGAITAGADYATIVGGDASAGYLIQRAAGEAAISIQNSSSPTIAEQAMGTVQMIAEGVSMAPSELFPIPAPRQTKFFRYDAASDLNPALAAPATVYQGEITLPYYQQTPTVEDLTPVKTSSWQANATIGAVLDVAQGNEAGTTPPSSMVTYRYPFPTKQGEVTVPMMVVTPDTAALQFLATQGIAYEIPEKWPTIIFAHGITGERSTALPMADALAFACILRDPETNAPIGLTGAPCYATVIIDQTLHGIAPGGSLVPGLKSVNDPTYLDTFIPNVPNLVTPNMPSENLMERHFNVTADAATNPIPMTYDPAFGESGSLFVNLTNFTNVRDNMRQMVLDLLNVNASIESIDVNADGTPDLDSDNVFFIGHSLGAVNGMPFVAINNSLDVQFSPFISSLPKIKAVNSMFAGGGIPKLLVNSETFAAPILQGLAGASSELTQGKSGLESYFNVFQGILDSVDVMNFAGMLADDAAEDTSTGVLLTLVTGDEVIPNAADDIWGMGPLNITTTNGFTINGFRAPLAGSEPMIHEFGARLSSDLRAHDVEPEAGGFDGDGEVLISRFVESGSHRTPITGTPNDVFTELLSETVAFFATNGEPVAATPIISNEEVLVD
ncbi:hypothetical protein TDB9533_03917 [Thalassocella blandensis]|nr:hypothetical protein TDB9533_03917 [Thalassocella blandensis]